MKRTLAAILTVAFLAVLVPAVTGCKIIPKKWYQSTIDYYRDGIKNGFDKELQNLHVPAELKDKNNQPGYLLIDLDKDGTDELLIGLIDDDASVTRFTNVIVCHTGLGGPYSLLSGGEIYLCYDGVICTESWGGGQEFMRWNQKDNAFTIIDGEGKFLPMKWELTPFE